MVGRPDLDTMSPSQLKMTAYLYAKRYSYRSRVNDLASTEAESIERLRIRTADYAAVLASRMANHADYDLLIDLHQAVLSLDSDELELLRTYFVEDLTFAAIGSKMGKLPGSVHWKFDKMIDKLRDAMGVKKFRR